MNVILKDLGKRTLVMGILNVTPDSFSDGGCYVDVEVAVERAKRMEEEGADIIDVGGESTHPERESISEEEEYKRVMGVIERLVEVISIPISIDTYKAKIAEMALKAGASIINDVTGLRGDVRMGSVAAQYGCPVVIMSSKGKMEAIMEDLEVIVENGLREGIKKGNMILDPGFGFGKTFEENLELMRNLNELRGLGCSR